MATNENPVEAKVIVEVTRKYVSVYRCDGTGAVLDADHFALPFRVDRKEAVSHAVDAHGILFDYFNKAING